MNLGRTNSLHHIWVVWHVYFCGHFLLVSWRFYYPSSDDAYPFMLVVTRRKSEVMQSFRFYRFGQVSVLLHEIFFCSVLEWYSSDNLASVFNLSSVQFQQSCGTFNWGKGRLPGNYVISKLNLTFICPCITNIVPSYNQQDATFLDLLISTDALHVAGGSSAHHQEHITVLTA